MVVRRRVAWGCIVYCRQAQVLPCEALRVSCNLQQRLSEGHEGKTIINSSIRSPDSQGAKMQNWLLTRSSLRLRSVSRNPTACSDVCDSVVAKSHECAVIALFVHGALCCCRLYVVCAFSPAYLHLHLAPSRICRGIRGLATCASCCPQALTTPTKLETLNYGTLAPHHNISILKPFKFFCTLFQKKKKKTSFSFSLSHQTALPLHLFCIPRALVHLACNGRRTGAFSSATVDLLWLLIV